MRNFLIALALLVPGLAWGQPTLPPAVSQLSANPSGARVAAQIAPAYLAAKALGAVGDGRSGPAHYHIPIGSKTALYLDANFSTTGTIVCNGTAQCTWTPTISTSGSRGFVPLWACSTSTGVSYRISVANAGIAGATLNAQLNGCSTPSGGSQTLTMDQTTGTYTGTLAVFYGPAGGTLTGGGYSAVWQNRISGTTCTLAAGGSSITGCPTNTFWPQRDFTQTNPLGALQAQQLATYVHIDDDSGACAAQDVMAGFAADTTQITLMTIPTPGQVSAPYVAPCAITSGKMSVTWGQVVFQSADVGRAVDIPWAGATGPQAKLNFTTTISAVSDSLTATLTTAATNGVNGNLVNSTQTGRLTIGTDDTANVVAAAQSAYNNGYRQLYWPVNFNTFLANLSGNQFGYMKDVIRCGEGAILQPDSPTGTDNLSVGACASPLRYPFPSDLKAKINLKNCIAAASCVLTCIGDSMMQLNVNANGFYGITCSDLARWMQDQLGKPVTYYDYAIGGQTLTSLDPSGPNFGYGAGQTSMACASRPSWYQTACTTPWLTLATANSANVYALNFAGNDLCTLSLGGLDNVVTTLRAATVGGNAPDIIWMTTFNEAAQVASNNTNCGQAAVKAIRSAIKGQFGSFSAPAYGNSFGLIDLARARSMLFGYDTEDLVTRRFHELQAPIIAGGTLYYNLPFLLPSNQAEGYGLSVLLRQPGTLSASTFWAAFGSGICFSVGNGENYSPAALGTQTGAVTTGYPNNRFCATYNGGTGNMDVSSYWFDFSATATVSITSGAATLTSTTSLINTGHRGAKITLSGAGCTGIIPSGTTINFTGNNTAGTSLSLSANATGTLASQSCTVRIYKPAFEFVSTGQPATLTNGGGYTNGRLSFQFHGTNATFADVQGTSAQTNWSGQIATVGGKFTPSISTYDRSSLSSSIGITSNTYAPAMLDTTNGSRMANAVTISELWGPCASFVITYIGPYGGACYAHESTFAGPILHGPLLRAQNWGQ